MARRSTIRASDADRDTIVERLREAAAEGRLASHELEHRVTTALRAQTYGELDETVSDLPGVPRERSRSRSSTGRAVATVRAHPGLILVAIPVAAIVVAALVVIAVLWAAVAVLALMLGHHRRLHHYHLRQLHAARHRRTAGGYAPWL